jgi:hypothetical protein
VVKGVLMKNTNRKWWLGLLAFLCFASTTFAVQDEAKKKCDDKHPKNCTAQVSEGGSSLVYLLGAGITCLGAMLVRSRLAKRKSS